MLIVGIAGVLISVVLAWVLSAVRGYQARNRSYPTYELRSTPGISILVPAWNERILLGRCVTSLKRLTYPNWECIIAAGGADQTFEYARQITADNPNFKVISQRPIGKNAALNDALSISRNDILVLLDADCEVQPDWLSLLIAPLTNFTGASSGNYSPEPLTAISMQFEMDKISTYFVKDRSTLHGGAIALHRSVIVQMGGRFPETVLVGTDWDLNARLERLGVKKVFAREAEHRTPFPSNWRQFLSNEVRWRRAFFVATLRLWKPTIKESVSTALKLLPYFIGIALVSFPVVFLGLYLMHSGLSIYLAWIWILYILWISGRRVGQVIEVAAYTRDLHILHLFWVPPSTLLVRLLCCVIAIVSLGRISPHFQGHRPHAPFRSENG